jgi:2',3'-cyclic-nucleotide 2'-phosphodiesterase (5'-nucleotidase family)
LTHTKHTTSALALGTLLLSAGCALPTAQTEPSTSASAPAPESAPVTRPLQLRVISTSDVHGHLAPEPASWANGERVGGAAAFAAYVERERRAFTGGPTIVLDGGDVMQGTPISNLVQGRSMVAAFNATGYNGSTLGNHEFDWTIPVLQQRIAQAAWPWLSANIVVAGTDTAPSWVTPTALITVDGVRIGLIGLSTQETPATTHAENVAGLEFTDGAAALDRRVPELRRAGAAFVIVLAHAGAFCDAGFTNCRGEIIDITERTHARPDLILAGHTHQVVQTVVNGVPIVEPGSYGTRYGVTDLVRVTDDSVAKYVRGVRTIFTDSVTPVPELVAVVEQYRREIGPEVERVIGTATTAIPRGSGENPMGLLIADAQRWITHADVALMNSGGVRAGLDAGPITWSEAYQVHPFGNRLVLLRLPGSKLRAALEHAVASGPSMAQVSGLHATYDTTMTPGSRITSITLADGTPLRDDSIYNVVVNDFLATGQGDGFTSLGEAVAQRNTGIVDLDALIAYIQELGRVAAPTEHRLRAVNGRRQP